MKGIKLCCALVIALALNGCHDTNTPAGSSNTPAPDGSTVVASPTEFALMPGQNENLTLTNNSQNSTTLTVAVTSGALPELELSSTQCANVAAGSSCTLNLSAAPGVPDQQGILTASSSAGASVNIPVIIATPNLSVSGDNISMAGNNILTLTNAGIGPVTFDSIGLDAGSSNLSLSDPTACGTSLAPGASCALTILATQDSAGTAQLQFNGGNYAGHQISMNVMPPSTRFLNGETSPMNENFYIDSGTSQAIVIQNTGAFTLQNISAGLFDAPASLSVTSNNCVSSLAPNASCSMTIHADTPSTANPDTAIFVTGSNMPTAKLPLTTGNGVIVTAIDPSSENPAARALSLLELQVQNHLPTTIQSVSITDAAQSSKRTSSPDLVRILNDTLHPDTCTGTLASNTDCTVWIQAQSGSDLGLSDQGVQLHYVYQSNPAVEAVNLIVSTNLYLAGHFSLANTTPCYAAMDGNGQPTGSGSCNNLARFDGSHWYQVGNAAFSVYSGALSDPILRDMQLGPDGRLYVAGGFAGMNLGGSDTQACASYVAAWDGTSWDNLGANTGSNVAHCAASDSLVAGPAVNSSFYKPIGITRYAHVNLLAFDAQDQTLFFNNVTSTAGGNLIYRHALNQSQWSVIASSKDASAISDALIYDAGSNRLYLSGGVNLSQGSARPLLWYADQPATANSVTWTAFDPFVHTGLKQIGNSLVQIGNTLYSYYTLVNDAGTTSIDYIARCPLPLGSGSCETTALASSLNRATLTGLDPSGSNLFLVGTTQASLPLTSTINLPNNWPNAQRTDNTGGVNVPSQIVSNAVNIGDNQYVVGTFNNLYHTNAACILKVNNGTASAVTGFNSSQCAGNYALNANALFGEVVVPLVRLGD